MTKQYSQILQISNTLVNMHNYIQLTQFIRKEIYTPQGTCGVCVHLDGTHTVFSLGLNPT